MLCKGLFFLACPAMDFHPCALSQDLGSSPFLERPLKTKVLRFKFYRDPFPVPLLIASF